MLNHLPHAIYLYYVVGKNHEVRDSPTLQHAIRRSLHPCTQSSNISYSNNRKSFIASLFGGTSRRFPGRRTRGEPIIKKICVPIAFQRRVDEERCQTLRTCMHNASNQTPCHVRCHSGLGNLGALGVHTSPPHMNEVCGRRGLAECYIVL